MDHDMNFGNCYSIAHLIASVVLSLNLSAPRQTDVTMTLMTTVWQWTASVVREQSGALTWRRRPTVNRLQMAYASEEGCG
jgi:hypothetical protein